MANGVLSAHLVVDGTITMHEAQERSAVVRQKLTEPLGVAHSTLELECTHAETMTTTDPTAERERLRRRGLRLAWLTIAWNTVEAVVAIAAGASAGSIALVGFGLDSVIEVASSMVIVWQFTAEARHGTDAARERRALRLIALSFFALAAYVTAQAGWDLLSRNEPATSRVGIGLAVVSLVVMPILARAKRRTGRRMGSPTLIADAAETQLCTYLSAVLLAGLVLDAAFGLWWADPLAAVLIAGLAAKEGREAWKGDTCC